MLEGWHGDDYLILFDETESTSFSARYDVNKWLPGHLIVGLKGWDDFIVRVPTGGLATVPTVPMIAKYLAALEAAINPQQLQPDQRYRGKIKWYIKPVLFGGDPAANDNVAWISIDDHIEFVNWWNGCYQRMT